MLIAVMGLDTRIALPGNVYFSIDTNIPGKAIISFSAGVTGQVAKFTVIPSAPDDLKASTAAAIGKFKLAFNLDAAAEGIMKALANHLLL